MSIELRAAAAVAHVDQAAKPKAVISEVRLLLCAVARMRAERDEACFLGHEYVADLFGTSSVSVVSDRIERLLGYGVLVDETDGPAGRRLREKWPSVNPYCRVVRLWDRTSVPTGDDQPVIPHMPTGKRQPVSDAVPTGKRVGYQPLRHGDQPVSTNRSQVIVTSYTYAGYYYITNPLRGVSINSYSHITHERSAEVRTVELERLITAMKPDSQGWNGNRLGPRPFRTFMVLARAGRRLAPAEVAEALGVRPRDARNLLNELSKHRLAFLPDGEGNGWALGPDTPADHDPAVCPACGTAAARAEKRATRRRPGNKLTMPSQSVSPAPDPVAGVTTPETAPESVSVDSEPVYDDSSDGCPACGSPGSCLPGCWITVEPYDWPGRPVQDEAEAAAITAARRVWGIHPAEVSAGSMIRDRAIMDYDTDNRPAPGVGEDD